MLTIYTDGAYSSKRDQGGIGIVFIKEEKEILRFSKMYKSTTNNKMELIAVILALKSIRKEVDCIKVISDSQYVLGCITKGWKRKKNQELWKVFDLVYSKVPCKNIQFEWTKGHSNNKFNNIADMLALRASQQI